MKGGWEQKSSESRESRGMDLNVSAGKTALIYCSSSVPEYLSQHHGVRVTAVVAPAAQAQRAASSTEGRSAAECEGGREAVPSGTPQDLTLVPWVLTHGKSFGSRKTAPLSSEVCPGQSFISCGGGTHMPGGIRTGQADAMLPKPCISCGSGFLSKSWHPWIFLPFNIKTSQLR